VDIQVMAPMKKGALGVENLNRKLQERLNPASFEKNERMYGDTIFREGDKVMQVKNNYQTTWEIRSRNGLLLESGTGVFNGDIGTVRRVDNVNALMEVEFDDNRTVIYQSQDMDELELAYAITIHKSQGSEYPAVIIPLVGGPDVLLNRNLLYTAVTRAQKCVLLIGSSEVVSRMIANKNESVRYTGLKERIIEAKSGIDI
jgi:exodeoxyribonuclease V alpha subunit